MNSTSKCTTFGWSSYTYNAVGEDNDLITPHERYLALGKDDDVRRSTYQALFDCYIDAREVKEIREATNKSWVLGSDRFKEEIETLTARQTKPKAKGGDRKSKAYHERVGINPGSGYDPIGSQQGIAPAV